MRTRGRGAFSANRVICGVWRTQRHRQAKPPPTETPHSTPRVTGRSTFPFIIAVLFLVTQSKDHQPSRSASEVYGAQTAEVPCGQVPWLVPTHPAKA